MLCPSMDLLAQLADEGCHVDSCEGDDDHFVIFFEGHLIAHCWPQTGKCRLESEDYVSDDFPALVDYLLLNVVRFLTVYA
ncbi:MAG: hypothetical protein V3R57_09885 [Candidatus Bathyarchaeia archaeon]